MTYQSPGVYIEEVPSGPQPIAAAPTSVVAVIGNLRKGPVLKPVRVTGWSDFERTFGSAHADGYTAEAVSGFFVNGGPAAWVVRVNRSLSAGWTVRDPAGGTSFEVSASSPGEWARALTLAVTPDTTGGNGTMYAATVQGPAALGGGTGVAVTVDSIAGVKATDQVVVVKADGTGPFDATVEAVKPATATAPGSLTLNKAGATANLARFDRVAARIDAGATTVALAAGKGIRAGDLLVAELAGGVRVSGLVESVVPAGVGLTITLTAPGLPAAVPGIAFDDRFARFRGSIGALTRTTVSLTDITFEGDPALVPSTDAALAGGRLIAANGQVAPFDTTKKAYVFAGVTPPPAGPVEVEARLGVVRFAETGISLVNPTEADILTRYGFLPDKTSITLARTGGTAKFVRAGGVFTTTDEKTHTFTGATFDLPTDASVGVVVRCAQAPLVGEYVRFGASTLRITASESPGGSVYVLKFAETTDISGATAPYSLRAFTPTRLAPQRFTLTLDVGGASAETFAGLALAPSHPRYFARDGVINGVSALVTVAPRAAGAPAISAATMPAFVSVTQEGKDEPPTVADYKRGLVELEAEPEPAIVICPDSVTFADRMLQADLVGAVVGHCEAFRRFAVVDAPDLTSDPDLLEWRNTNLSSTYAAVYAPHLTMTNLVPDASERFRTVPPSGFVAGVLARTDRTRGVFKAPGNEELKGTVALSQVYTQRRQDLLNPGSVNLIRAFPGRGTRVWGARNATDDVTWRYVNVRRLFNLVERSVETGTQWVVFEPNIASTWIRIKVSLENFLDQLWRAGGLAGTTPEQAYRVRVGLGETMTETDVDLGLVITEVAIAPTKPAEFVVFRFSHKRLSE